MEKIDKTLSEKDIEKKKPRRGIYTKEQDLAYKLAEYFGESDKMGKYIGLIKRNGHDFVELQFRTALKRYKKRVDQVRIFMFLMKKK